MSKAGNIFLSLPLSLSSAYSQKASPWLLQCNIHTQRVSVLYWGSWKPFINKLLYKDSLEVYFMLHGDVCSILFQGNVTPAQNNNLHPRFHGSKENHLNYLCLVCKSFY